MPTSTLRLSRTLPAFSLLALLVLCTAHCAEGATLVDDVGPSIGPRTTPDASAGRDAAARPADSGTTTPRDAGTSTDAAIDEEEPEADAASDATTPPLSVCPSGLRQVGEYAIWQGKVNIHRATGGPSWITDEDCTSGADHNTVAYCRKFWPNVTQQVELDEPTTEIKPFHSAGCTMPVTHRGYFQYACCAPN